MKKQTIFILVLAFLLGSTSCIKDHHKPDTEATVSTFAGSGQAGSADGTGAAATFNGPASVAIDAVGNMYVTDMYNGTIRKISSNAVVTTFAGQDEAFPYKLAYPMGLAIDAAGNLYVADTGNNKIRKISATGVITTFAGSGEGGAADGKGTAASFHAPTDVALDASGNVFVADEINNLVRKISPDGVVTTFAGTGRPGSADGRGTAASFYGPNGLAVDAAGNVYVADEFNDQIRKITADGVVTTFAGSGKAGFADGRGCAASFNLPCGLALDGAGNLYVSDYGNSRIRKVTPQGEVTTVAGNGVEGFENGPAASASFKLPLDVTVDRAADLYVADWQNNMIRKIAFGR